MKQYASDLLKEVLKLPPEGRAALAGTLLEGLDQEVDQDAEATREAEIDQRLRDRDSDAIRTDSLVRSPPLNLQPIIARPVEVHPEADTSP